MISYENELLAAELPPATAARLVAMQRRETFSLFAEIRALAWIGAMLVVTGVGVLISEHVKDLGPITIALAIAIAAAACYVWAWMRRGRESLVDDSILLLGGMLVSADAGWIESQWHLFGARNFLILAVFHAVGAYAYKSRSLLSISISALAAWLGIDRKVGIFYFGADTELALRMFACAAILAVWREVDRRVRPATTFTPVFEHTGITLAFWGALLLTFDSDTTHVGMLVMVVLAVGAAVYAFRSKTEAFLLYAAIYLTIALDAWTWKLLQDEAPRLLVMLITAVSAVVALFIAHRRFRSDAS